MDTCLFCNNNADDLDGRVVRRPTTLGIKTILKSALKRKDEVSSRIISKRNYLLKHSQNVRFHYSCRKTFCSQNINNTKKEISNNQTRHERNFNACTICIICGLCGTLKKRFN